MLNRSAVALLAAFLTAGTAAAQAPETAAATEQAAPAPIAAADLDAKLPVTASDISDRPYTVVGEVKAGVRKATVFSKAPSHDKIYRELWERAQKLGADAVILATYGKPHINAISWGSVTASGKAIRFTK